MGVEECGVVVVRAEDGAGAVDRFPERMGDVRAVEAMVLANTTEGSDCIRRCCEAMTCLDSLERVIGLGVSMVGGDGGAGAARCSATSATEGGLGEHGKASCGTRSTGLRVSRGSAPTPKRRARKSGLGWFTIKEDAEYVLLSLPSSE